MRNILLSLFVLLLGITIFLHFSNQSEELKILIGKNIQNPFTSLCILQNSEKPLENCYPTCQLNHSILKNKISEGLPTWAKQQINEDIAHLKSMKNFDFNEILKTHGISHQMINLVLFKIHRQKLEVVLPELPAHLSTAAKEAVIRYAKRQYQPIEDVLAYLVRQNHVKDTAFLLAINDYPVLKTHESLPIFAYAKDLSSPAEAKLLLLPDWMNFCSSTLLRNKINNANKLHPWKNKKNQVFWRGGTNDSTRFRHQLVAFSEKDPTLVDAEFTYSAKSSFTKPEDHLAFKYLISIDGARCSWERLIWLLHSNSLTLKHETEQVQWYYKGIKPYVHYLPVTDETSIIKQVAWAEAHPKEVADIIERSTHFVEQNLKLEDFYHYLIVLMDAYTNEIQYNKVF